MSFLDSRSSNASGSDTYQELSERNHILFTGETVPDFCGALKSLSRKLTIARGLDNGAAPRSAVEALKSGTSLCLFRDKAEPKWEDESNQGVSAVSEL